MTDLPCHGCTGGGDGANDVGPPGEILGGFSFGATIESLISGTVLLAAHHRIRLITLSNLVQQRARGIP